MRWYMLLTVILAASLLAGPAFAEDMSPTLDTSVYGTRADVFAAEKPTPRLGDNGRRWVALTLNPIAPLIGRWGANVEIVPVVHHGIVLSGSYVTRADCCTSTPSDTAGPSPGASPVLRGGSGEIGYRYYTSRRGPAGLFFGPSFVAGGLGIGNQGSLSLVGGAFDVGGQLMFHGFVFGAGLGVQALHASRVVTKTDDPLTDVLTQSMISPRVLATIGYAL
jgi:hypothetical protein